MTTAVLASPDFLYRSIAPRDAAGGDSYELSAFELASRLSFFLWSQGPDDELLKLAASGELAQPAVLDAQVKRMLADPRAEVLVTNFALHWLDVDDLDAVQPDKLLFPEFTEGLRQDFAEEIELFVASVLLEDQNVRTLLTADYTFLNERLARHYGIEGVVGPQFRRVELTDARRHGLLGKGAVLLRTSYGDRTSPVLRGAWVLDKLMGTPPTPPPPGVETNLTQPEGEQPKTVRARLEQHREDASCNACHGVIDPYGLALENFTAIGALARLRRSRRRADRRRARSCSGGRPVDGPVALAAALLERDDQLVQALAEKLMMYAVGRELEYFDMPQVRAVVRDAAARGLSILGARRRHRAERRVPHAGRCRASIRFSSGVFGGNGRERVRRVRGVAAMFLTKKHLSRRTVLQSRRRVAGPAAARCDDSRAYGARADGRRAEAARRVLLYPARRDHVEHALRRRDRRSGRRAAPARTSS